jgi:2-polyprenyl-3-methyl-5-hydroxy-6-metoxy-1,4-benzoquinol methylase
VLDLGCGVGLLARAAAPFASRVVGVDQDEAVIREARRRTDAPNVEFMVGEVFDVLSDERFDLTVLSHIAEHVDDPASFLTRLRPMSRKLLIEVPDFDGDPLNRVRLTLGMRLLLRR